MQNFEFITSRQNKTVTEAAALRERKNRREKGLFIFEGKKLLSEALEKGLPLQTVFLREDAALSEEILDRLAKTCRVIRVTDAVYEKLSEEKSPEGVFCVAKTIDKYHKFATIYISCRKTAPLRTLLLAASVRDPGNLGTILRSAKAFGAEAVILSSDCADLYSPKTVRASMGTLFDLPVLVTPDPVSTVRALREEGCAVYAAALDREAKTLQALGGEPYCCFVVGNEGHGLDRGLIDACSGKVFIPMAEGAESLNVSAAAAVLLWSRFSADFRF